MCKRFAKQAKNGSQAARQTKQILSKNILTNTNTPRTNIARHTKIYKTAASSSKNNNNNNNLLQLEGVKTCIQIMSMKNKEHKDRKKMAKRMHERICTIWEYESEGIYGI